jgi:hypothetical protein
MAVVDIKESVRLKLELDGGMKGDKQIVKSKIFSKVKPTAESQNLYEVAKSVAGLQTLPLSKVKRLEEIQIVEE